MPPKKPSQPPGLTDLTFESHLWAAADALRGSMDAADYKHVVLGIIFLKHISGAFEEHHARIVDERARDVLGRIKNHYRMSASCMVLIGRNT